MQIFFNFAEKKKMKQFCINNFGPISNIDISLGDITILVGPQASGKSLSLELLKLVQDKSQVVSTLQNYNYILDKGNGRNLLNVYFGDGAANILTKDTSIVVDDKQISYDSIISTEMSDRAEEVFYIPAQRILSIADGRPKNFMEFDMSTPYVLRAFSDTLRLSMQGLNNDVEPIFPQVAGDPTLKEEVDKSIFHGGKVYMEEVAGQRKMKMHVDGLSLPFMTWSAGQKEFMPLLLAFHLLEGNNNKLIQGNNYNTVVIEEPEMGLHPQAIMSVLMEILYLESLGKKVIISTHSSTILEFAWAFATIQKELKDGDRKTALCQLMGVSLESSFATVVEAIADKDIKTYFFSRNTEGRVISKDISSLDAGSESQDIAEWGGLASFSSRAADIVYNVSGE